MRTTRPSGRPRPRRPRPGRAGRLRPDDRPGSRGPVPASPTPTGQPAAEVAANARAAGARLHSATMAISLPGHDGGPLEGTFSADTDGGRTGHVAITGMGAAGTWFPDTPGDPLDSSSCCEPDLRIQRQAGLNEDGTPGRNLAAAAPRRVDGVPTGTVTPTDPRGLLVRYDIAAEGEPRVLSTESGAGNTTARFNGFDQPVRAAAPAAPRRG